MSTLKNISLLFLLLLSTSARAREVHFYKCGSVTLGYHSGATGAERRASFAGAGFLIENHTHTCYTGFNTPHYQGQYAWEFSTNLAGIEINIPNTPYTLHSIEMWFNQADCPRGNLSTCSACIPSPNSSYSHMVQQLASTNSASAQWIWDSPISDHKLVKNFNLTFDVETGAVTGYTFDINTTALPFGAVLPNIGQGIAGNGNVNVDPVTGVSWEWGAGVTPPIDPQVYEDMKGQLSDVAGKVDLSNTKLDTLNTSLGGIDSKLSSIGESLDTLNASQKDYTSAFSGLQTAISSIGVNLDLEVNVDVSGVESRLDNVEASLKGDGALLNADTLSIDASLVSAQDTALGAIDSGVRGAVSDGLFVGNYVGGLFASVCGEWASLPRVKPQFGLDFELPLLGRFQWDMATQIPDSWWAFVRFLRALEVVGLFGFLMFKLTTLLHQTFGGAS